ncbi:MAG: hypothetical protein M3Z13_06505 [Candidatus Dormibacteraeota bacterium]|nr:hypothetical protein [Candidatus Dormibacteraeota bacterium]
MFGSPLPIERVAGGELSALAEIYDRYAAIAYGTGLRILGDEDGAELVVRQSFGELWERAAEVAAAGIPVGPWLLHTVRRRALQTDAEMPVRSAAEGDNPATAPEAQKAVANLPARLRDLLNEAMFVGPSLPDIAIRSGRPIEDVRSDLRVGLEKLASGLEGLLEPGSISRRGGRRASAGRPA